MAKDHSPDVRPLDVVRHNQAKIFDLELWVALRVLEHLPELENFAESDAEDQGKILGLAA